MLIRKPNLLTLFGVTTISLVAGWFLDCPFSDISLVSLHSLYKWIKDSQRAAVVRRGQCVLPEFVGGRGHRTCTQQISRSRLGLKIDSWLTPGGWQ